MKSHLKTIKDRWLMTFAVAALAAASLAVPGRAAEATDVNEASKLEPCTSLETQWGIEVSSLRLTAAGHLIDFRYKVLDPVKAAPLGKLENKAYLIDQASGRKCLVPTTPKAGQLRQHTLKLTPGRIYFSLFANPGQLVKAGSKVTVVIGDFKVENLTVE